MSDKVSPYIEDLRAKVLPDENEIIKTWESEADHPIVSVLCNTYNQVGYIEDALRGFLFQKTKFAFEIIVHDDASTDGTTDMIRGYALKYPSIIKPIIRTENQYSKGIKPTRSAIPYVKGKYVAFCEGDDYWTDEKKLQVSVNKLESTSDAFSIVGHNTIKFDEKSGNTTLFSERSGDFEFTISDIVTKKWFVHTSSFVVRSSIFDGLFRLNHDEIHTGDFFILAYALTQGKGYFFSRPMSVYRWNAKGSLSVSKVNESRYLDSQIKIYRQLILDFPSINKVFFLFFGIFKCYLIKLYAVFRKYW